MAKAPNYTPEMVEEMKRVYSAAETQEAREQAVRDLAEKFNKSLRSIRQRLVTAKVYVKKAYVNKNGEVPLTKEALVSLIAKQIGVTEEQAESLTKANKAILEKLLDYFEE